MSDILKQNMDVLLKEWDHCENAIRGLDGVSTRIRSWAVTLFGGCIVFSLRESNGLILLAAIPMLLVFFVFDVVFKSFQANFISRVELISGILRKVTKAGTEAEKLAVLSGHEFPNYDKYFNGQLPGISKWKIVSYANTWWLYVLTISLAVFGYFLGPY